MSLFQATPYSGNQYASMGEALDTLKAFNALHAYSQAGDASKFENPDEAASWRKLVWEGVINTGGEPMELDFFEKVVAICKEHNIWIVHDIAYADIVFDGYVAPSILQVPGAKDIAVEFFTLSKSYNMPGWRIGFMCGNPTLVSALTRIKSYMDYGAFTPIQVAATAALNGPEDCIAEMRATYKRRRDVLVESFGRAGWDIPAPEASMFAWVPIPEKFRHLGSLEFSKLLIEKAEVAVAPGIGFGEHGDDFVRIAIVENEQRIRQEARNIGRFLKTADQTLHNVIQIPKAG